MSWARTAAARYVADSACERRAVPLDGLTILFHRPSGLTHVLGSPAPELIELLSDAPHTVRELLAALDLDEDGDTGALITERLGELAEAGLVRRL